MQLPADVINRSLDAIGAGTVIGDFSDGTTASEAARRIYGPTLRQLLRAAHWSFARKEAPLLLLADASGQTLAPSGDPISSAVERPWIYAYAWPSDGVAARWLPLRLDPLPTTPPVYTNMQNATGLIINQHPARFLVSSSDQFPAMEGGEVDWDNMPDLPEGQGPISRRVILTNVPSATLVYTKLTLAIEEWDALFDQAMVSLCAARLAMPAIEDKKRATIERNAQIAIARDALMEARARNANDAGFPQSINRTASWISARRRGAVYSGDDGLGVLSYSWEQISLGSVF